MKRFLCPAKKSVSKRTKSCLASKGSIAKVFDAAAGLYVGPEKWSVESGIQHLLEVDETRWKPIIEKFGIPKQVHRSFLSKSNDISIDSDFLFASLLKTIIYQQLSGKSAASIFNKLNISLGVNSTQTLSPKLVNNAIFTEQIIEGKKKVLVNGSIVGISRQKRDYILSLSEHFNDEEKLKNIDVTKLSPETIKSKLINIKGVGEWSVEMLLIFTLYRGDVFSPGDLALRKATALILGKPIDTWSKSSKSNRNVVADVAKAWSPYRSLAAMYCYELMDSTKK